jgi:hypothetical protein
MIIYQSSGKLTEAPQAAPRPFVRTTTHAVDRYRERVDCGISRTEAASRIQRILADGIERDRPRAWMQQVNHQPATAYVYCPLDPETCLVVRGGAVLTVLTRELCDQRPMARRPERSGRQVRVARRRQRELAWLEESSEEMLYGSDLAEAC